MNDDIEKLKQAVRVVAAIKGFYVHAVIFAVGITVLFLVNWVDLRYGANWWVQWPLILWGSAMAAHAAKVFLLGPSRGSEWEERKIRELMERDL